jgi:hypothetical protein
VFAGCNLLAGIVVFFFYYESAGLNLEQVDSMYTDPNVKPWQSGSWVPEGHKSRYDAAIREEQMTGTDVSEKVGTGNVDNEGTFYDARPSQASADTQVGGMEKKSWEAPQTYRGNFNV